MALNAGFRVESRTLGSSHWQRRDVAPGELFVAGAGVAPVELCWRSLGPGRSIDVVELYLEPQALRLQGAPPQAVALVPEWRLYSDPLLSQLLAELARRLKQPDSADELFGDLATSLFALQLARAQGHTEALPPSLRGGLSRFALRQVRELIAARLGGTLRLAQLAAAAGLSASHFSRAFKISTGLSPHAYVRHCRLEEAKRLLSTSSLPLADIARRTGFGGPAQLSTQFRAGTGTTPSAFRRLARL